MKIIFLASIGESFSFYKGFFRRLRNAGHEVLLVSGGEVTARNICAAEGARYIFFPFSRQIDFRGDLVQLVRLCCLFLVERPSLIVVNTPKASVIGALAAALVAPSRCIFNYHGRVSDTARGFRRVMFIVIDYVCIIVSRRTFCVANWLMRDTNSLSGGMFRNNIAVVANGSAAGVDVRGRFVPDFLGRLRRPMVSSSFAVPLTDNTVVIGYVGRLANDKGIVQLLSVWDDLDRRDLDIRLVLVGAVDGRDGVDLSLLSRLRSYRNVAIVGSVEVVENWYKEFDIFLFPSLREGLPYAVLEAQAMGTPVVGFDIAGVCEIVRSGYSGILAEVGNTVAMADAVARYCGDRDLRLLHGSRGRELVSARYDSDVVHKALYCALQDEVFGIDGCDVI
jgi:glycosyltransferase involved in cell wall biosynthesis